MGRRVEQAVGLLALRQDLIAGVTDAKLGWYQPHEGHPDGTEIDSPEAFAALVGTPSSTSRVF